MSEVVDKIRSRGYWDVEVRPLPYSPDRLEYEHLESVIEESTVRMRGWPVPYIDSREPWLRGEDWVGQDVDSLMVSHIEAWRLFTSGQFVHLRGVTVDWEESNAFAPQPASEKTVPVWEILYYLTEMTELASRLALKAKPPSSVLIRAKLSGVADRGLVVAQRNRAEFVRPMIQPQDVLEADTSVPTDELVAEPRTAALQLARHLFLRFGWKPPMEQLREHQQELIDLR